MTTIDPIDRPAPAPAPKLRLALGFAEGALRWARTGRQAAAAALPETAAVTLPEEVAAARPEGVAAARLAAALPVRADGDPSDLALASMLLAAAMQGRDARGLSARLLDRFGSFAGLLCAPDEELRGIAGLGPHGLAAIRLVQEAALRLARASVLGAPVLTEPARLMDYLSAVLSRERIEQFRILFLDAAGRLIADEAQARGTVNHTPVYPREVVRRALDLGAAGLILVHNHPTGDPTPSQEDLTMTRMVTEAAALLGVTVVDHVIVGNGRSTSLREQGLVPERADDG